MAAVGVLATACANPNELTRDKAKSLLEAAHPVNDPVIYSSLKVARCLEQAGLGSIGLMGLGFSLAPEAGSYLKGVSIDMQDLGVYKVKASFNAPPAVAIDQITGITDTPLAPVGTAKTAEYAGHLDFSGSRLPPVAAGCLAASLPIKGQAEFRRYDDGWRMQQFTVSEVDLQPGPPIAMLQGLRQDWERKVMTVAMTGGLNPREMVNPPQATVDGAPVELRWIDLNGDGAGEYILHRTRCAQGLDCNDYAVVMRRNGQWQDLIEPRPLAGLGSFEGLQQGWGPVDPWYNGMKGLMGWQPDKACNAAFAVFLVWDGSQYAPAPPGSLNPRLEEIRSHFGASCPAAAGRAEAAGPPTDLPQKR